MDREKTGERNGVRRQYTKGREGKNKRRKEKEHTQPWRKDIWRRKQEERRNGRSTKHEIKIEPHK